MAGGVRNRHKGAAHQGNGNGPSQDQQDNIPRQHTSQQSTGPPQAARNNQATHRNDQQGQDGSRQILNNTARPRSGGYDGPGETSQPLSPRPNPFVAGLGYDPARPANAKEKISTRLELPPSAYIIGDSGVSLFFFWIRIILIAAPCHESCHLPRSELETQFSGAYLFLFTSTLLVSLFNGRTFGELS